MRERGKALNPLVQLLHSEARVVDSLKSLAPLSCSPLAELAKSIVVVISGQIATGRGSIRVKLVVLAPLLLVLLFVARDLVPET